MRRDQYELLFRRWSDEVHAGPSTLLDNVFPVGRGGAEAVVADDDREIVEMATMALVLVAELWALLPSVEGPDPARVAAWMEGFMTHVKAVS